ncbi:nitronate monooxygenase family protein [uncultured Ruegeria sp.]|uniref:NAD(P)H-dependent flavin oxidoreductase n=1 Tax=uncultured Ruegeria sp. TaxID=259304 RepID=UPI002611BABD|nr:nitronate monooxygenase family protein [uncultured Ruegeria sp.]
MTLPIQLHSLRLPLIAAPMYIVSNPELVIAQCQAGIVGSVPALNARDKDGDGIMLEVWLKQIIEALDAWNQANPETPAAPFAVNQIVHKSNERLERDIEICARWKVPIWITSLGAREEVNEMAHEAGAIVLHDVISDRFARKAIEKGADGLIAVAAGAGGHTGAQSPFALVQEIRQWFHGPLVLSGAIASGASLLGAQAAGADFGYMGTPFIATKEANAPQAYQDMLCQAQAQDIVTTAAVTGVNGNYLSASLEETGVDPSSTGQLSLLGDKDKPGPKPWRDIWSAGQGVGSITEVTPAKDLIGRIAGEYDAAKARLSKITGS